jgi:two-component system nitrogen regulation sensor histidine kinase GlnL
LQHVLDAVLDGVIVVSPDSRIELINDEACRMLERSAEGTPGRSLAELVGPQHPIAHLVEQVRATGRQITADDVRVARRYGSELEVEAAASPLPDEDHDGAGVVVVLRDRTVGNSLRKEVSQRERLASYGHIAAGIAHEVKNPLSGIRGAAELLGLRASDERSRRTAALIVQEVDRITTLVDDLMVFAKGEKLECVWLNLHQLLDQVLDLSAADPLAANVRFDRVFDPSIPELLGDPNRLTQVFLNLVRNAIQAMAEPGGTLTISTGMALENRVVGEDHRSKPTVEITLHDDGPGIPSEILDQLATPFFTTKPNGTGLGLAVSRHWVARHGGRLEIESEPERGAKVRVLLPLNGIGPNTRGRRVQTT